MMGNPEGTGKAFELSEKIRKFRREIIKAAGHEHIHELGLITDSVYGPKEYVMEQTGLPESSVQKFSVNGLEFYGAKMNYDPTASDAISQGWEYHKVGNTTTSITPCWLLT